MDRLAFNLPYAMRYLFQRDALRCMSCNYDIRAQAGRMRRCPECGALNDVLKLYTTFRRRAYPVSHALMWAYSINSIPLFGFLLGIITAFIPSAPVTYWISWMGIAIAAWICTGLIAGTLSGFGAGWLSAYCCMSLVSFEVIVSLALTLWGIGVVFLSTTGGPYWPLALSVILIGVSAALQSKTHRPLWRSHALEAKERLRKIQRALDERRGINRRGLRFPGTS